MSLNQNREECLRVFGEAFNNYFNLNLEISGGKGKAAVVEMYSAFYDMWLTARSPAGLPVTPLGLISEISRRFDGGETFAFPYIKPDSFYRFKKFNVNIRTFTAETHPVIQDLKTFLDVISEENKNIKNETGEIILGKEKEKALKNSLNLYSPVYEEFLHCLGSELKLVENIQTIKNTYIFRAASDYENFFGSDNIFDKIFEASVRLCRKGLNMVFPKNSPFFYNELIKEMLLDPVKINDILGFVSQDFTLEEEEYFGKEDFELDLHIEPASPNSDEVDNMRMNAVIVLKTALSKWFYTVFGSYLKIIRPYCSPVNETCYLMQYYGTNKNYIDYFQIDGLFTLMPESHNLTSFGLKLFEGGKNYFSIENKLLSKLSVINSIEEIEAYYNTESFGIGYESESGTKTFILKIHCENKKSIADSCLEFTEYNLLTDLCKSIVECCNLGYVNDFGIFTSESRSPFSKYTSIRAGGRNHKKAEITFLNEVISAKGDRLWIELEKYAANRSRPTVYCFTAEVSDLGKKYKFSEYPMRRRVYD